MFWFSLKERGMLNRYVMLLEAFWGVTAGGISIATLDV